MFFLPPKQYLVSWLAAVAKNLSPSHSKDSISLYNDYMLFLKLHSSEESKLLIKDSFKGFASKRYERLSELSSMFVNHNLTIDLFFVNQVHINANNLVLIVHSTYNSARFSLCCEVASIFHE